MALSIVHGPPNSGRAGVARERFAAALGRDPVLVVPTFDDVVAFGRELCPDGGALLGGSVTTFDGLFREVAEATESSAPPELTRAQRLRLFAAAADRAKPRILRASAARPGFAPALEELVTELQASEVSPADLAGSADELGASALLAEVADLYAGYIALRDEAGRGDAHLSAARAIAALRSDPDSWRARPVIVYGFDDLTEQQLSLVRALAPVAAVTVAITFETRSALDARSSLLERLRDAADRDPAADQETQPNPDNTSSHLLFHFERGFLTEEPDRLEPDPSLQLLRCAGERAEAEAVGGAIARLLAAGAEPDEIAVAVRDPSPRGAELGRVLQGFGIPVAVEADLTVTATATGAALAGLLRAAQPEGSAADVLAFLRAPGQARGASLDNLERQLRRNAERDARSAERRWSGLGGEAIAPLEEIREAGANRSRVLRVAADVALDLSQWPVKRSGLQGEPVTPEEALELRAGAAIAAALDEIRALDPCHPSPDALAELIGDLTIPLWSGPATGRVRISSPYALRAARFRHVFVTSLQDGEFPSHRTAGPFLSDDQRRAAGLRERIDSELEERYLFHVCLALPTDTLHLSHRYCDDDGKTLAPSPYLDEIGSMLDTGSDTLDPLSPLYVTRSLADVVFPVSDAPSQAELGRSLAAACLNAPPPEIELAEEGRSRLAAHLKEAAAYEAKPGPLVAPEPLAELGAREAYGGTTIEEFTGCSYRWFVGHELRPGLIDPAPDQLVYGGVIHQALHELYRDPPAPGSRPTEATLDAWVARGRELLAGYLGERSPGQSAAARVGRHHQLDLIESYLIRDARRRDRFEPAVFEGAFGLERYEDSEGDEAPEMHPALNFDGWKLHGSIDRIDIDPASGEAIVHDYKIGKTVTPQARFDREAKVQVPLYMRAVAELWEKDPVAGVYQPLGRGRRAVPRGLGRKDVREDEALEQLGLPNNDWVDPEAFEERLREAEKRATSAVRRMRTGDIDRDPLEDKCPPFCTFAPICRLDRRAESSGEQARGETASE